MLRQRRFGFEVGCSRMVILAGAYAIKLPNLKYRWPAALWGIIHNFAERNWWRAAAGDFDLVAGSDAKDQFHEQLRRLLCPVVWSDRYGFCVIMRRADPLPREMRCPVVYEWLALRFKLADCACPAENKSDSYGLLGEEIVAIDYA